MIRSNYCEIDTPALLVDYDIMKENILSMQVKANRFGVGLRPHTKTHRTPEFAQMQMDAGAVGITVAKVGEAEVMAAHGLKDIFIANEIVGISKLQRIRNLHEQIEIALGVDDVFQVDQLEQVFEGSSRPIRVLIEIEVGENRSGVIEKDKFIALVKHILSKKHVLLTGVFSHDGQSYKAASPADCIRECLDCQRRTLEFAELARELGAHIDTVSIGSTPSLLIADILDGVTEIRPGTYIFMDNSQAGGIHDYSHCAASVLGTVISKPTADRIITDTGAKALTAQQRQNGICANQGLGYVKGADQVHLSGVFDEHGIIYSEELSKQLNIGDKIEIIPNHICPVCNLYDSLYLVSHGSVLQELEIACRGKSR